MRFSRLLVPSPADIVFLLFLLVVPAVRGYHAINTDGDLGRHIRLGETILDERALFQVDRFSHTMKGQPFVPYEWLSEVAFAAAHRLGGLSGVLVLTGFLVALAAMLVALFLQRSGVGQLGAFSVAVLAGLVGAVHWLARPHLFTLVGAVATLWALERGGKRGLPIVFLVYVAWANLHGGFLYGLVLIALYVAGAALDLALRPERGTGREIKRNLGYLGAALAGTLLNPAGPELLLHVTGYLRKSYLVDGTAEYQSPDFHAVYGRLFLVVLCGVVASLALSGRRPNGPRLLAILANLAFSLISLRNIPLFGVVALPLAALHFSESGGRWPGPLLRRVSAAFEVAGQARVGVWSVIGAVALAVLAASGRFTAAFDPSVFPVAAVDRARTAGLEGNIFNEFAWGGYLLYAWPERLVFIDGQTDFYGEDLTREYVTIRELGPGWSNALERRGVELVLLPPDAPLVRALSHDGRWETRHRDATSILLQRRATPRAIVQ